MAIRTTFSDPLTGRFISAEAAQSGDAIRRTFEDGILSSETLLQDGLEVGLTGERIAGNWDELVTSRTLQWHADGDPLNIEALADADVPDGATQYRILYQVPDNPDYPRGYMSSKVWYNVSEWPPDSGLMERLGASGIERIFFDVT